MGASYKTIQWNRQKRIYDVIMGVFVLAYLTMFCASSILLDPEVTQETLIIRSTATLALLMLHVILAIGPLTRINQVFLPLLYNRRHLGVAMFCIGAIHAIFSTIQFHALGNINPILSIFLSNVHYNSVSKFPFEVFGFIALIILMLMAVTSHDFWLHTLGPRMWKTLHMMVYFAYAMVILHVFLGILQYETSPVLSFIVMMGLIIIIALHLTASKREHIKDNAMPTARDGYVKACELNAIPNDRACIVNVGDERIAIYKYDRKVSAVSNTCKHQLGPLGEGKIIDGCITCPWHGYQYLPHNGTSPPPFKEKISTYEVQVIGQEVWVNPVAFPEGTAIHPAIF